MLMSQDGPLIDLVSRGKQDESLLSEKMEDSMFGSEHSKHTNFSRGSISVDYKGNGNWGSSIKFIIPKDGDLLSSIYLNVKLPEISTDDIQGLTEVEKADHRVKWAEFLGNGIIDKCILRIGGEKIDELDGVYMQIHTDLYDDDWNKLMMLGHDESLNLPQKRILSEELYIPLKFWFSDSIKRALPLVALQHHDVEIEIKFRNFHQCYSVLKKLAGGEYVYSSKKLKIKRFDKITLEANMIYLDIEERKKVATSEHKILITQVEKREMAISSDDSLELDLNHPVKELIYFMQPKRNVEQGEIFNFSSKLRYLSSEYEDITEYDNTSYTLMPRYHLLDRARIMFNGKERVSWKNYKYYYYLQNYEHFRNSAQHYVYIYSFSVRPTSDNPTGSCNFSRIDNAQLQFKLRNVPKDPLDIKDSLGVDKTIEINGSIKSANPGMITLYATNYNYLIIKGGMGGLAFST